MSNRFDIRGRVAVVTGATGGIGTALCKNLSDHGARVVATDLQEDAPFSGSDNAAEYRRLDVTDAGACRDLAVELKPEIWVNNAGILGAGSVVDQQGEAAAKVIEVNLVGVVNGTLAALSSMLPEGRGRILNMGSFASWTPAPGLAVYSGTKHGVRAFSVATAAELAGTGVRISVLCPEGVWTPMLHDAVEKGSATMSFTAKRLLDPEEVAEAGVNLLTNGSLIGSIPRNRAVLARLVGASGNAIVKMNPYFTKVGRAGQKRMRARLSSGG